MDDFESEQPHGEVPEGLGPEMFRERLQQVMEEDHDRGAEIILDEQALVVADIEHIEAEPDGHGSRVRLRNGLIIGGVTGAAIVAALATLRYRRHRRTQG